MSLAAETDRLTRFPEYIGPYELILPIASGGMATVFLARHHGPAGFEREVALKLMHPHLRESADWVAELLEEAKLAAGIRHPNVVQVLGVDDDALGTYLAMEYIEGDSLAGLVRAAREAQEPMPVPIALRILCDALAGLHAAHELRNGDGVNVGLVHRDFSPQNILVGTDGLARLADFGIAKASTRLTFTRTGLIKGKITYMSPEQARGQVLDRRSDVWAAGVVAWEIFAQRRLYGPGDDLATGLRIITERPPSLKAVNPAVADAVASAVASALVLERDARCATALELRRLLADAGPMADITDVAEYVSRVVEVKLEERRLRAAEVLALRSQKERVVRSAAAAVDVATESGPAAPAEARAPVRPELPTATTTTTRRQLRRSRRVAYTALAVGCLAGAAGVLLTQRPRAPQAALEVPAARAPARPRVEPIAPPPAMPAPAVEAQAPPPSRPAPAPARRPARVRRAHPAPRAKGPAAPAQPALQPNPYE